MSTLTVHVQLQGIDTIEAALARLNPFQAEHLLEALARLIRESVRERLMAGGPAPDGSAWAPNLENRRPILHRSGALARSIDYAIQGMQVIVGSGLIYAAIHQFGGSILPKAGDRLAFRIDNRQVFAGKVTMPARPYIGISADDRAELVQAAVAHLRSLFP